MKTEFDVLASRGAKMPQGLDLIDQMFFQALSFLYDRYKGGYICRDDAVAEKNKLVAVWSKTKEMQGLHLKIWKTNIALRDTIEHAHNQFRTQPTLENAKKLSDAIDEFQRKGENN